MCWVKEARHKLDYSVLFQVCQVQGQAKLIYSEKSRISRLPEGWGAKVCGEGR